MLRSFRFLLAGLALLVAGSAQAVPFGFYAELKTSAAFPIVSDVTKRLTVSGDFDPFTIDWSSVASLGSGLGSALVPPTKTYTHTFAPDVGVVSVEEAWLFVSVIDDFDLLSKETAKILVDGSLFAQGGATLNLFFGTVTASIGAAGDTIEVEISALKGDFKVLASALKVKFTPVPEPTTVALLAIGLVGLAWRSRSQVIDA